MRIESWLEYFTKTKLRDVIFLKEKTDKTKVNQGKCSVESTTVQFVPFH